MSSTVSEPAAVSVSVSPPLAVPSLPADILSLELSGDHNRWYNADKLQRYLLDKLGVKCDFIVKDSGQSWAELVFDSIQSRDLAHTQLLAPVPRLWKVRAGRYKSVAEARAADAKWRNSRSEKAENKKRKRDEKSEARNSKAEAADSNAAPSASATAAASSSVIPYFGMPYELQLKKKSRFCETSLKKVYSGLMQEFKGFSSPHVEKGQICPLDEIVASPVLESYRNKSEFTCGHSADNLPLCGFLAGLYREGLTVVDSADDCVIVSPIARLLARLLTALMRNNPEFPPYERADHSGIWRTMTIKNSQLNQLLVTIQIHPNNVPEGKIDEIKRIVVAEIGIALQNYCLAHPEESEITRYELKGLQLCYWGGLSNAAAENSPMELIFGSSQQIMEKLFDLEFRVGHQSFFQVNVKAAELLFAKAAEWANCGPSTTLLDICCGTGTIGLSLAKKVKRVIGLEIIEAAVEDAKENAIRNGIDNAVYLVGKAESTIEQAIKIFEKQKIQNLIDAAKASFANGTEFTKPVTDEQANLVGIVDPPRSGLHPQVVRALRGCNKLNRLVYISCNPASLASNLHYFLQPASKRYRGRPFVATRAAAFDLFPHTTHCEMIVLLEREQIVAGASNNISAAEKENEIETAEISEEEKKDQIDDEENEMPADEAEI